MDRDRLVLGLAAVFAGLTVLLVVLAFTHQLFLLAVAVPFGATTYFMWYQASGRLQERTRTRRVRAGSRFGRGSGEAANGPGGFGAGARNGRSGGRRRVNVRPPRSGPTRQEAYETLGLGPDADEDEVKQAYRRRVKEVHPDTPSGDEEEFKRVTRAYERLTDDPA